MRNNSFGKVSIIVPVYNCKKYLPSCLKSLLEQTYSNLEIILIDDGSSDGSDILCDAYAERYTQIKVFHQKNAGPGIARNTGLEALTGNYLTYVDADDYVAKNYIETMLRLLEQYSADIAEVGLMCMYRSRNVFENEDGEVICFEGHENLIRDFFSKNPQIRNCIAGRMYDMRKFQNIRFSEKSIGEDSEYSLKMLARCEKLVKYHKCLYACRAYQSSLTRQPVNSKSFDVIEIILHDILFVQQTGIEVETWSYVFEKFVKTCYNLMGTVAEQKKEHLFKPEFERMLYIYEKIWAVAKKYDIEAPLKLSKDLRQMDIWAVQYRKKNYCKITVKHVKYYISLFLGWVKMIMVYEYQFRY